MSNNLADFMPPFVPLLMIFHRRTGEISKATGAIFGELSIGGKSWPTMERGQPYVHARKGLYNLEMVTKIDNPRPAIRFADKGVRSLMIHDAVAVAHIEGCIAPGTGKDTSVVTGSATAMTEIFDALGGWKEGMTLYLSVANNVYPGDQETAPAFIKRRLDAGKA